MMSVSGCHVFRHVIDKHGRGYGSYQAVHMKCFERRDRERSLYFPLGQVRIYVRRLW